jgi:hypothetical protein
LSLIADVPLSVSMSISIFSLGTMKTLKPACCNASSRSSGEVILIGSTTLIRKGSIGKDISFLQHCQMRFCAARDVLRTGLLVCGVLYDCSAIRSRVFSFDSR